MKSFSWFFRVWQRDTLIWAAVIAIVGVFTALFWEYTQDDVFISFAYSRNIAKGAGFVFNPGERVQGTTTPLYTLIMAGVYLITTDLLHAGNLFSGFFLLITAGLAWNLLRRSVTRDARIAGTLIWITAPLVYISYGMETLLYCALLALALLLWSRERRLWAMLTASLLTWTRADGVVLAGTLGLIATYDWWQTRTNPKNNGQGDAFPASLAAAYGIGIAPWFIFAWAYFGTPLPQTFSAKEQLFQGTFFVADGVQWWKTFYGNNPLTLIALPLIVIGFWRAIRQREIRPIAVWALLYSLGYTILNIAAFWYYTPLFLTLILLATVGGHYLIYEVVPDAARRPVLFLAGIMIIATAGLAMIKSEERREPPPRMATYQLAGEWLNQHSAPDSSLLVRDLGIVGYYAQRYTLDTFGLIVPGLHYFEDEYVTAKYKTDWILTTQYWEMQNLVQEEWFQYHYAPEAQFSTPGDTEFAPMTLFRRTLAAEPPRQIAQGLSLPLTCRITVAAGDTLPETTSAQLFTETGQLVSEAQHPFLWGQYPFQPAEYHEVLIEQIALPVNVVPGHYSWQLACDTTLTGEVEVLPIEQITGYVSLEVPPEWDDFAQLAGIALPQGNQTWAGGQVELVLHWQANGTGEQDYSVFVHLIDGDGVVRAQTDGYPRNGDAPLSSWQAGDTIVDVRKILLPPNLPAGEYSIVIGWYDWQTLDRIVSSTGQDAITLPLTINNQWPGGSGLP